MYKILVIDDKPVSQLFLKKFLEKKGCEVDVASDGDDAVLKADGRNYQCALVDLVLPGKMNGVAVIKKLRHIIPKSKIIAYSGFSDVDITERVTLAGANNFISKPFSYDELTRIMF